MSRTTRDLWLEDRREVLDRHYEAAWCTSLRWVTAAGLAGALVLWGWRGLVVLVVAGAALAALLLLPSRVLAGDLSRGRLLDEAVRFGLTTTGAFGLLAVAGGWGLVLLLLVGGASPPIRRFARDSGAVLRWSLAVTRDAGTVGSPVRPGDDDPP